MVVFALLLQTLAMMTPNRSFHGRASYSRAGRWFPASLVPIPRSFRRYSRLSGPVCRTLDKACLRLSTPPGIILRPDVSIQAQFRLTINAVKWFAGMRQ